MTRRPPRCEAARVMVPGMPWQNTLPWHQVLRQSSELSPSPFRVQGLLQVRAHAFAMVDACHLGSWALYIARFLEYYKADVGEHFRPPTQLRKRRRRIRLHCKRCLACATSAGRLMRLFRQLLWMGISCDVCSCHGPRCLSHSTRRIGQGSHHCPGPEYIPPPPASTGPSLKRRRTAANPEKATKPRSGECFKWMDGQCYDPDCPYKQYCVRSGSTHNMILGGAPRSMGSDD